jgi:hypothetical protein
MIPRKIRTYIKRLLYIYQLTRFSYSKVAVMFTIYLIDEITQ